MIFVILDVYGTFINQIELPQTPSQGDEIHIDYDLYTVKHIRYLSNIKRDHSHILCYTAIIVTGSENLDYPEIP